MADTYMNKPGIFESTVTTLRHDGVFVWHDTIKVRVERRLADEDESRQALLTALASRLRRLASPEICDSHT